jgi:rhamnosyltransferase
MERPTLIDREPLAAGSGAAAWRICGVIVTFNPDEGLCRRALALALQVDGVVIVDNGSAPSILERLTGFASGAGIDVIANAANLGIATALNQGVAFARAHGYTHALLFDQDTEPAPHLVRRVRQIAGARDDVARIAVLGVNMADAATGKSAYRFRPGGGEATEVQTVMTSGSVLSLEIASELGRFRDDFFIDDVDEEYCLRARANGYKVLLTHEALAVHALGAPKFQRLLWRTFGTSNHSAVRRYYMTRNYIILAKTYAFRDPGWVMWMLWQRFKSFLLLLLLDDDRMSKICLIARGVRDGVAGRTGKLPADRT